MKRVSLSVVMPVFNEAAHLAATIDALVAALQADGFDAELVLVDDGSSDGSAAAAYASADGRLPLRLLTQPNRGRFEARRTGLAAASGEFVLFLDSRVRLEPDALRFVRERLEREPIWNGHVEVAGDNVFGRFWRLLAEIAWRDYFDHPRTTSFGLDDFDRFPKGTTCFLAPRSALESAFARFHTRYADTRLANDDTPILRALATNARIAISPRFACVYSPRSTMQSFLRHSLRRGVVFVDGHGTPASRFFPLVAAFYPVSAVLVFAAMRRLIVAPAAAVACGLLSGAYGVRARRPPRDVITLALVTPLYAVAHGAGMWRGLGEIVRKRLQS